MPVGFSHSASLLGHRLMGLSLMELSAPVALLILLCFYLQPFLPVAFPIHTPDAFAGNLAFTKLMVLFNCPTTPDASLPISLSLIGSLILLQGTKGVLPG